MKKIELFLKNDKKTIEEGLKLFKQYALKVLGAAQYAKWLKFFENGDEHIVLSMLTSKLAHVNRLIKPEDYNGDSDLIETSDNVVEENIAYQPDISDLEKILESGTVADLKSALRLLKIEVSDKDLKADLIVKLEEYRNNIFDDSKKKDEETSN